MSDPGEAIPVTTHASEMATVWVFRAGERDQLVEPFLDDGEIGLVSDFPDGGDLDRAKVLKILGVGIDDEPTKLQLATTASFLSFVRRMQRGDVAAMLDPVAGGIVFGVVVGDYDYRDELDHARARHRRRVEWRRRLPFDELPDRLDHLPLQRPMVEDVPDGRLRDLALQCCRGERGSDPMDRPAAPSRPVRARSATPRAPRAPRPPKAPVPLRADKVERAERRCTNCLVTKTLDLFEDSSDVCVDCG